MFFPCGPCAFFVEVDTASPCVLYLKFTPTSIKSKLAISDLALPQLQKACN